MSVEVEDQEFLVIGDDGSEVLAIRRQARAIQVLRARENRDLFGTKIQDLNGYLL